MTIFNLQIWGEDADKFMALSCAKKKEWIKANTNQQNDELIEEFIKAATRGNDDECQGCKDAKNKSNGTISKTVSSEVAKPATIGENKAENNATDTKRTGAEKGKGK